MATRAAALDRPKLALRIGVAWGDVVLDVVHVAPAREVRVRDLVVDVAALPLVLGARARVHVDTSMVSLDVEVVEAGPALPRHAAPFAWAATFPIVLSAALHMLSLAVVAWLLPPLSPDADAELSRDRLLSLLAYLDAAALHEREAPPPPDVIGDDPRSEHGDLPYPGGTGSRSYGEEGTAGNANLPARPAAFAVRRRDEEVRMAREVALREASAQMGWIATMMGAAPHTPTASWGSAAASGTDAADHRGAMWGESPGEAFGTGGLGLTGGGEGGGGSGEGVGLGTIGALGHGIGTGTGRSIGAGHMIGAPGFRFGATSVSGRLPPETIQRIVRQNFGRFRLCYENGLRLRPTLEGGVTVRFLIDRSGAVATAADGGSSLPDPATIGCVVRAFTALSFPAPEGGTVTVIYPIAFAPEG